MSDPEEEEVTVDADGVSVRKTLNDHQFETLAVVFDVRSGREGPTTVSIVDTVPEDVPEEDVGFHPEYGGEHWRAEDGQVVFTREFGPGEQYTTVYGVRDFDGTRANLLAEPAVTVGEEAAEIESIDDVVSAEDSDVVREVISGERDTLPGLEAEASGVEPADAEVGGGPAGEEAPPVGADEPTPADAEAPVAEAASSTGDDADRDIADALADTIAPVESEGPDAPAGSAGGEEESATDSAEAGDTVEADADAEAPADEPSDADAVEVTAGPDADAEAEEPVASTEPGEGSVEADAAAPADGAVDEVDEEADAGADEVTVPVTGGIARVLAKELRAGNVSYEDRRLLRAELLPDDGSTDARIQRLQTQVADLEAYTEALEAFLDEEGGAEAVLSDVESRMDRVDDAVEDVEDTVDDLDDAYDDLAADVEALEGSLGDLGENVESVAGDVRGVAGDVDQLEGEVDGLRDDVQAVPRLTRRLDQLEEGLSAVNDELDELATFRDRLSSVFGAGGGGMPGGDEGEGGDDPF